MIIDSSSDEEAAKAAGIDFLKCDYFDTYKFKTEPNPATTKNSLINHFFLKPVKKLFIKLPVPFV